MSGRRREKFIRIAVVDPKLAAPVHAAWGAYTVLGVLLVFSAVGIAVVIVKVAS